MAQSKVRWFTQAGYVKISPLDTARLHSPLICQKKSMVDLSDLRKV